MGFNDSVKTVETFGTFKSVLAHHMLCAHQDWKVCEEANSFESEKASIM